MYLPLMFVFGQHFRLVSHQRRFVICCPIFFYMQILLPLLTLVEIRLIRHDFNENRFPLSRPRLFIEWRGAAVRDVVVVGAIKITTATPIITRANSL